MAVKIVRQMNQIAVLGARTSAAALAPGGEGAAEALRHAGLISRLQSIGYEVADCGDDPSQLFQEDPESPRARNLPRVLAALESLRPRVELVVKTGALPLVLSGDGSVVLATVAGLRRYFRHVGVVYVSADADLQTPATTGTGYVDEMTVSHIVGRGASEMVRFWSEPPLVREPDVALFGTHRMTPAEEQTLQVSPLRRYLLEDIRRKSPAKAASEAIERIHGEAHEFVLHFDVDAIGGFAASNAPAPGGLRLEELREAFSVFAAQPRLAAIEVTGYNPQRDVDGAGAAQIVDFLAETMAVRREKSKMMAAAAAPAPAAVQAQEPAPEKLQAVAAAAPGESWSSDRLEDLQPADETASAESASPADPGEAEKSQF